MSKAAEKKSFHTGSIKKSIVIDASREIVWKKLSNIVRLDWLINVKKTVFLSKIKHGIGAIRKITFRDGNEVEEHVVAWENGKHFSYIASSGLPLRIYHATISIMPRNKKSVLVTWQSYFNTQKMAKKEFNDFVSFIGTFYQNSLKNLKSQIEK